MIEKDRWAKVESIYHAALEHEPEERAAFVSNECAGDQELKSEVESLLKFDGQAEAFMARSALNVAAKTLAASHVTSEDESKFEDIGPYHLLELIGEGGSGNVYLAVDTRLDRKVAIKILSVDFTEDVDRVSRFKQEARATSSLNHPNIVTIFEVGEIQDRNYIVTEFVEGSDTAYTSGGCFARRTRRKRDCDDNHASASGARRRSPRRNNSSRHQT